MLEAEVKLALDAGALRALRGRLQELGAEEQHTLEQCDTYFAHPTRDFAETDEALRLRVDARGLRVTYKGPKLDPPRKTREEIEFPFDTSPGTARELFERLGFSVVADVVKTRAEFSLPGSVVSLDTIEGLGTFCEVEVQASSVEQGREQLRDLCTTLGLAHLSPIPESYLELLLRA